MSVDKPVYCCQINREIHKFLNITVDTKFHRRFLRAAMIATVKPLYAAYSQVIECFYSDKQFLAELNELARASWFIALSKYPALSDLLDVRRRMYSWDKSAYPMYFAENLRFLSDFPTHAQGDPDTTAYLRSIYSTLYRDAPPAFENRLTLHEREALQRGAARIRAQATEQSGAITSAFFRRDVHLAQNVLLDRTLSKILPLQFTNVYSDVFGALTPTGFPGLEFAESLTSFPYLDYPIILTILRKLGLEELILNHASKETRRFVNFRGHQDFHEFVWAKDELLTVLAEPRESQNIAVSRSALVQKINECQINLARNPLDASPLEIAAQLYQAIDDICSKDPRANRRRMALDSRTTWRGKYLLLTATDAEDEILREELSKAGFPNLGVRHAENFSYVEYFKKNIGKVYHVRTSSGSGGASGAFIMGKNCIERLDPEYVISVGICFGLREDKQFLGDIVISEFIHDYEKMRYSEKRFEDRGATREASPRLLSRARATLAVWSGPTVHIGVVASGEKLVDHRDFREFLKALTPRPIAGDMEAWGLSAVCHELRKDFIMIKGICDWGVDKADEYQVVAARSACEFMLAAMIV